VAGVAAGVVCGLFAGSVSPRLGTLLIGVGGGAARGAAADGGVLGVVAVMLFGWSDGGGDVGGGGLEEVERRSVRPVRAGARGSWILLDGCGGNSR
jgi:hypothetical protein